MRRCTGCVSTQNWKPRHFELNGPELMYFQESGGKLLGKVMVPGCVVMELLPGEVGGARYAFEISTDSKSLIVKVRTQCGGV